MSETFDGLIVSQQSGFFRVEVTSGMTYICRLRGRLKEEAQASDIAAIGDRVTITTVIEDGTDVETGIIETIAPRKNALSRAVRTTGKRGAGQAEREHVIIANADQVLFVFSASQPPPNLRMLDRMLVACEKSAIKQLTIVVNKVDLEDPSLIEARFAPYGGMGYRIVQTSALNQTGIDELRDLLKDRISAFTGPSGVGKTSLLNCIQPGLGRAVKAVGSTDEGTHTTRDSALIKLDTGGYLADTPGIRSISLWDVEPDELDGYFVDIAPFVEHCRFRDCTHTNEPGCAVIEAVKDGKITRSRYNNFRHLRDELKETYIVYER